MTNTLSRTYALISTLNAKLLGFEYIKELYVNDPGFANVRKFHSVSSIGMMDSYLEKINYVCLIVLCVSACVKLMGEV